MQSRQTVSGKRAQAGRRGEDVRSDLWVELELRDSGGPEIELRSKVEPYYGAAIRRQAAEALQALGVPHARLAIEDLGALPYTIAARLETVVRRALPETTGRVDVPRGAPLLPPSTRDRRRRSRLYLPGNEPKYMPNAGLYRPDGVILDLEDSVHPLEKDAARLLVRNALRAIDFRGAERMVRINPLPLGLEDLQTVLPEQPDLVLIPKVESPDDVREVERAVAAAGGERPPWLMPILETALGIEQSFAIARASDRVVALTIGLEDYAADLGLPKSADGRESLYARQRLVVAARAAGVQAIDSVYGQVDDDDGLRAWAAASRRLGFQGMGCVHPRQIRPIHDAFNPTAEEIEKAQSIVRAFEEAQARGLGVVSLGSKMIDPPVLEQARRIVEQARGGDDD